ncbi:MAG: hypothetical protein KGQ37_12965 [Hyphomicrobiales bacterium]|nr:hypothetical protein [Hyphomicrobiales bacterium]
MRHLTICASFGLATLGLLAAGTSSEHSCTACRTASVPALLVMADGHGNGNGNGNVGSFNGNFNQGNGQGNCNIGNGHGNFDQGAGKPGQGQPPLARAHCRSTWQQNNDDQQKLLEHMLQTAPWRMQHQGG